MENFVEIYKRFVEMRNSHSGIYNYAGYDKDLTAILEFVEPYVDELEELRDIYRKIKEVEGE